MDRSRLNHHRWRNSRRELGRRGGFGSHQGRSPRTPLSEEIRRGSFVRLLNKAASARGRERPCRFSRDTVRARRLRYPNAVFTEKSKAIPPLWRLSDAGPCRTSPQPPGRRTKALREGTRGKQGTGNCTTLWGFRPRDRYASGWRQGRRGVQGCAAMRCASCGSARAGLARPEADWQEP